MLSVSGISHLSAWTSNFACSIAIGEANRPCNKIATHFFKCFILGIFLGFDSSRRTTLNRPQSRLNTGVAGFFVLFATSQTRQKTPKNAYFLQRNLRKIYEQFLRAVFLYLSGVESDKAPKFCKSENTCFYVPAISTKKGCSGASRKILIRLNATSGETFSRQKTGRS